MSQRNYSAGELVSVRGREWIVLPSPDEELMLLKPLGGSEEEVIGIFKPLGFDEDVLSSYDVPYPDENSIGNHLSVSLLFNATRLAFRNGAGPFRSFGKLSFRPRSYQIVPLIMALKQERIRLLIADDVGIGKTIEAGMIARELLDRGEINRFAVLCLPHLCEQWQSELRDKFGIEAVIIRSGTLNSLERQMQGNTGASVYRYFPYQIISIDFAKGENQKQRFLAECPDFLIVDEAHTCANPSVGTDKKQVKQQRHKLLRALSEKQEKQLVLLTATPHNGKQNEFQSILGLLKRNFEEADFDISKKENVKELTNYYVQRRREDIRHFVEDTAFPERDPQEISYQLSDGYLSFYKNIIGFARELVGENSGGQGYRQRMRYWAALALLRGVMSSPKAGLEMLRTRAFKIDEETAREAFETNPVGDSDYGNENDQLPTEVVDKENFSENEIRKLSDYAKQLESLGNLTQDWKAKEAIRLLKLWIKEGLQPVVFCRYIETAKYLGALAKEALSSDYKNLDVAIITGELPDDLRKEIIEQTGKSEKRLLICTDCLSEGINLQQHFNALLHYDLPWNPNRLEQREGRIDRFGQKKDVVKTFLLYGKDNPIDAVVLEVLLRKARLIRQEIGISVPFPEDNETINEAVINAVLLRKQTITTASQLELGFDTSKDETIQTSRKRVSDEYDKASKKERELRELFAQHSIINKLDIEKDLRRSDEVLGTPADVQQFVLSALRYLKGQVNEAKNGFELFPQSMPPSLRQIFAGKQQIKISFLSPTPDGYQYIGRNHPLVEQLSQYLLAAAFEKLHDIEVARAAVYRSSVVKTKTVLVQLRLRNVIEASKAQRELVAEETLMWGYTDLPQNEKLLSTSDALNLMNALIPEQEIDDTQREIHLQTEIEAIKSASILMKNIAEKKSAELVDAHSQYRHTLTLDDYRVGTIVPPDIISIQIIFPVM